MSESTAATVAEIVTPGTKQQKKRKETSEHPSGNVITRVKRERTSTVSRTVVSMSVELQTEGAQKVFDRSFDNFAKSAYTIELVAPIVCTEAQADIANGEVELILNGVVKELQEELTRLDYLINNAFLTGECKGKAPLVMDVEVDSQYAAVYLKALRLLDQVVMKIDVLWINGEMDRKQRGSGTFMWQQRVNKVAGRARQVSQVLQKVMRTKTKSDIPEFPTTRRANKRAEQNVAMLDHEMEGLEISETDEA